MIVVVRTWAWTSLNILSFVFIHSSVYSFVSSFINSNRGIFEQNKTKHKL